ncbi:hypothetical protein [Janthinobacterium sp. UMAB-60]|uniref:hypothetical protein n=1 Tax=Janthinobacterium sp. UMAB-60 TaxID=1365365 RepID=UPI001C56BCA5|nr:hypothetical protein [Janthinobacterium sp. UMAB-60]
MRALIATPLRRLAWSCCAFFLLASMAVWFASQSDAAPLTDGDMMKRYLVMPFLFSLMIFSLLSACAIKPATKGDVATATPAQPARPYMAQVVGVQWLNPLQRRDYSTEWQLLWTLGLAKPNQNDDKVRENPARYSKVQSIGMIASGSNGEENFEGYHHKYVEKMMPLFRQNYFSNSTYFYNAHALKDRSTRRELAGIHVEYALPAGRLDPVQAADVVRKLIMRAFSIGNPHFPNSWTTATPPDVRVTMGDANAGFTSLAAGLAYLQAHPDKTVWVMNWDAPSFPPKDEQIDENIALLILAGTDFKTQRAPLAWLGFPATAAVSDYQAAKGQPPRAVQAWASAIEQAAEQANLDTDKIAYVIHDAGNRYPASSERIGSLAQSLTLNLPDLDFTKQTFNTSALLGEMGAGTALTNVALAVAYANHLGRPVLVAGTGDLEAPVAVLVAPPAVARPIDPEKPWFRARGEASVFLPWWGLRHDAKTLMQGYSN